jgi:orotidine-5'-phosphate decarboxylase
MNETTAHIQNPAGRIIIALDVDRREKALALVGELREARVFKVGMELFTAEGPVLLADLRTMAKSPFLDLKFHDIPNTVGEAVRMAVRHGAFMMTLHTSGGGEMMARAAAAGAEEAGKLSIPKPFLLGVTVLTSMKGAELQEIGMAADVRAQVQRLAGLALKAGLDGVVCSPQEIEIVRKEAGPGFFIVTPGIRPSWAATNDQKRIMTPTEALEKGANYLVIGRPVTAAPSPREAFLKIVEEIKERS